MFLVPSFPLPATSLFTSRMTDFSVLLLTFSLLRVMWGFVLFRVSVTIGLVLDIAGDL